MEKNTLFAQDDGYKTMLHTSRWQKLRCLKLAKNPYCERCAEERRYRMATEVHHRIPVLSAADRVSRLALMYDEGNLVSLCRDCHVAVHRSLGKQSKEENRRRLKVKLEQIAVKYGI